jgi:hypothetical protein
MQTIVSTMAQARLAQIKAAQHRNLFKKLCKAIPTTTIKTLDISSSSAVA